MLLKTLRAFVIITLVGAGAARAQSKADSVFARARQLVASGNGAAGRVLVDSVIAATTPDTPEYGDALYWRASLATTSADAERDYRRIVVEYPVSMHSGDALLQLAQLEMARGDRGPAATHLDRFLLENPQHPERARAGLLLVRLLFEQKEIPHGCSVLRRTLNDVPDSAVETRNQLQYYSPRCAAADANPASQLPLPAAGDTSRARRGVAAAPNKAAARYTLQVAAFTKRTDADALAKRLKARDIDARVVGKSKPFRVRIGRYETRADAATAAKQLKARKIAATVTDIGPDDK
jgi:septal ring-binding cell division protein DamX